eukprot:355303_1
MAEEEKDIYQNVRKGLDEYYKLFDKNDYLNDDGEGKFELYCEENDFDEEGIFEEFDDDPDNSVLVSFDDDFPLTKDSDDEIPEDLRNAAIMQIIKFCYFNGRPPIRPFPKLEPNFFDITDDELNKIDKLYREQCPAIFD